MVSKEIYYTIDDAARMFQKHRQTIKNWIKAGKIEYHELSSQTFMFTQEDIDNFLARTKKNRYIPTDKEVEDGDRNAW